MGGAKAARQFGALPFGGGRGIVGQTYGIVTKSLKAGFVEQLKDGGTIHYPKAGKMSVSKEDICKNIEEFYECCNEHLELKFFVAYTNDNNNLNGYSSLEIFNMFMSCGDVPSNVYFHDSFKAVLK